MSKGLEALKKLIDTMPLVFLESRAKQNCINDIECELKVSQFICKKLNIHIEIKQDLDGRITYWLIYAHYGLELTKEEYDLLKEALL